MRLPRTGRTRAGPRESGTRSSTVTAPPIVMLSATGRHWGRCGRLSAKGADFVPHQAVTAGPHPPDARRYGLLRVERQKARGPFTPLFTEGHVHVG